MSKAGQKILSELNHQIGLDRPGNQEADFDRDAPRDTHDSHAMIILGGEMMVCRRCHLRDYWPGIGKPCKGVRKPGEGVHMDELPRAVAEALAEFFDYWRGKRHAQMLPTVDEWLAELIEFRRM